MLKHCLYLASAALLVSPARTQGPDILIPTGSNDGAFALVDSNKDGKYSALGECWDYFLGNRNASPKWFTSITKERFVCCDTVLDELFTVEDVNKNGLIEATERKTFFSFTAKFAGNHAPRMIVKGPKEWLWSVNTAGDFEGIYRHKDLNDDGDAHDTGETIAVLTESMSSIEIANTPKTSGTTDLPVTALEYITYDPTYKKGRFIVEDEELDQTIALEDANEDGDFADAGECYLFCALKNGGPLAKDVNPDVAAGKLPSANDIAGIVVDSAKRYYLMSADRRPGEPDAAMIFRCIDGNSDGDVNDAGEVKIFWDGSLDSKGATSGYNNVYGMSIFSDKLFLTVERSGNPVREQLLVIQDSNNDGDANDKGETTVVWDLPADRRHYRPAVLPAGTLALLSGKKMLAEIGTYSTPTCRTSLSSSSVHNIQYGHESATSGGSSKPPILGNKNWTIRTWGAKPSSPGGFAFGLTKFIVGLPLDAAQTCRIYNSVDVVGLFFRTNATGEHLLTIPIPTNPKILGLKTYWQSYVDDPTAPAKIGITTSQGLEVKVGDWSYTK